MSKISTADNDSMSKGQATYLEPCIEALLSFLSSCKGHFNMLVWTKFLGQAKVNEFDHVLDIVTHAGCFQVPVNKLLSV